MGRKSNTKDHLSQSHKTNQTNTNDSNDLYRKRLRSWKQTSTQLKSNHTTINDEFEPLHRSTIYTFPIHLNHDNQSIPSSAILSESLTTNSAFYCPSISYTSIQTIGDVNNNHVTTMNIETKKRKNDLSSCESFSSQFSQIKTLDILTNTNDEKNIGTEQLSSNNLQLTYHQNPTKRSRFATDNSNHRSLYSPTLINDDDDDNTIDINQIDKQEPPLSSSMNNESLINNSNSMEAAVKMIQPIVDIIFNAFEDQLKHIQTKTMPASFSNPSSISSQFYSPMMIPYLPLPSPVRPIVLHAVNFNIQLTTKQQQPSINSIEKTNSNVKYLTNVRLTQNDNFQSTILTELKEKVVSYILSNNFITTHHGERHKFKRIIQLAVVGVSVLCGYFLL